MTAGVVRPSRSYDAVTFDFWNTLCYEPDRDVLPRLRMDAVEAVLRDAGLEVDRPVLDDAHVAAREVFYEAWSANRQYTGTDAARFIAERIAEAVPGASQVGAEVADAFTGVPTDDAVVAVEGTREALVALKEAGVQIGIICDVGLTPSRELRRLLDRFGLLDAFDHWSFSDEVGIYKPARRIFEHALGGLGGSAPERAAHVGDRRRTDVAGAQGAGMLAVRFTSVFDDDDPQEGPSGDAVIATYEELLPALSL